MRSLMSTDPFWGPVFVASWRIRWITSAARWPSFTMRSEEHTSELQSQSNLVCRLLLEKKKKHTCIGVTVKSKKQIGYFGCQLQTPRQTLLHHRRCRPVHRSRFSSLQQHIYQFSDTPTV